MDLLEILIIICIVVFVLFIFLREIFDTKNNIRSGECKICSMKNKRTIDEIREVLRKEKNNQNN